MKEFKFLKPYTYGISSTKTIEAKEGETHPVPDECIEPLLSQGVIARPVPVIPDAKSIGNAPKDKSIGKGKADK